MYHLRFFLNIHQLNVNHGWVKNPSDMPDIEKIERLEEPYIKSSIITQVNYVGAIMSLCIEKRGIIKNQYYLMSQRVTYI